MYYTVLAPYITPHACTACWLQFAHRYVYRCGFILIPLDDSLSLWTRPKINCLVPRHTYNLRSSVKCFLIFEVEPSTLDIHVILFLLFTESAQTPFVELCRPSQLEVFPQLCVKKRLRNICGPDGWQALFTQLSGGLSNFRIRYSYLLRHGLQ